ncbi:MAG: hypothetical protein R6U43_07250 [Candidatus Krumholzibacteriales bacterium]
MKPERVIITLLAAFLFLIPSGTGAREGPPRIVSVQFRGVRGVDKSFLAEEISMGEGDSYSTPGLREDIRRLENLRLFSSIEADTATAPGGGVLITYTLEENLYWIITPFLYKEDDYGVVYGLQYANSNLFGRKYSTYCAGNSGGLKGGQINFAREMTNSRDYGFEIAAEMAESEHPVLDYWQRNHILGVSVYRRIGSAPAGYSIRRYLGFSAALEVKEFKAGGISLASDDSDVAVKNTLSFQYDDTDILYNPGRGKRIGFAVGYWNINGSENIKSASSALSAYKPLSGHAVLAGNISCELYADPLPFYYLNFLGGYNFRGCRYGDYHGDSYLTSSIELRILPRRRLNLWKSFLEPAAALFVDGAVIGGYDNFYRNRVHTGYGISFGVLTPYISPFFHLAWNEKGDLIDYLSLQSGWKF